MKTLLSLVAVLVVASALCNNAFGQNQRTKTFPLGKPIPDSTLACFSQKAAVDLAQRAETDSFREAVIGYFKSAQCFQMIATFTYRSQVHRGENGQNVFKANVGTLEVYVPSDWSAEGTM